MTDRRRTAFKYPYKRLRSKPEVTQADAASLDRTTSRSGAGKAPRIPAKFEADEKARAIDDPQVADSLSRRMLYAHAKRGSSNRVVLEETVARAKRAPNRRNLERMRAVANELGKRRGGGKLLRQMVTQDLVDKLMDEEV